MTATLSEQRGGHTALEDARTLPRPRRPTPQSPASSKRLARSRARALGQRTPYTMSVAERLLIARLIERDEQAFSEIVRLYGDKVFSLIYRMLGNRQEAEDVAQDVFITVFKTIESFRGEAKFSTWLLRIAANHAQEPDQAPGAAADRRRRPGRRVAAARAAGPARAARAGADRRPRQACWRRPQTERLMQEAIANLDEDQRLLVVLRDVEEMSYQEIGEITGSARRDDKIALAPRPHGDKGVVGQAHAVALTNDRWTTSRRRTNFSDYVDGSLPERHARRGRAAPGGLHPVPDGADGLSRDGRLARAAQADGAAQLPRRHQAADLQALARAVLRPRWKLFGRIPFEWVSLGTIIAMLVYYIAMMHGSPSGVRPAP